MLRECISQCKFYLILNFYSNNLLVKLMTLLLDFTAFFSPPCDSATDGNARMKDNGHKLRGGTMVEEGGKQNPFKHD